MAGAIAANVPLVKRGIEFQAVPAPNSVEKARKVTGIRRRNSAIGQVVRHRLFPFRGVIFDVDPQFNNTEEWYEAIPADVRPRKDQPFYHLLAENSESQYIAYVSSRTCSTTATARRCITRRSGNSSTSCRMAATSRRAARSTERGINPAIGAAYICARRKRPRWRLRP